MEDYEDWAEIEPSALILKIMLILIILSAFFAVTSHDLSAMHLSPNTERRTPTTAPPAAHTVATHTHSSIDRSDPADCLVEVCCWDANLQRDAAQTEAVYALMRAGNRIKSS